MLSGEDGGGDDKDEDDDPDNDEEAVGKADENATDIAEWKESRNTHQMRTFIYLMLS